MSVLERRVRIAAAALGLAVPFVLLVADAGQRLAAVQAIDGCGIQAFGVQYPTGSSCYASINTTVALLAGIIVLGVAILARRGRWSSLAVLPSGLMAFWTVPPVLQQTVPLTLETFQLAVLAAIPFLIARPSGPAASDLSRAPWILTMVALTGLAGFDMLFSGFFSPAQRGLQLGFVVVLVAVALAGWVSGRLAPRTVAPVVA